MNHKWDVALKDRWCRSANPSSPHNNNNNNKKNLRFELLRVYWRCWWALLMVCWRFCSKQWASHSVHRNLFHVQLSFRKPRVSQVDRRVLRNCKQLYDICLVIERRKVATPTIGSAESVNKVLYGKCRPLQFVINAFFPNWLAGCGVDRRWSIWIKPSWKLCLKKSCFFGR